jgi:CheY-like chemotaxis protein
MTDSRPLVLVVDDDVEWQEIISEVLESCHCSAVCSTNVKEAESLLDRHKFSLVTIDLSFKNKKALLYEGPELLEYIEQNFKTLPCIVISASRSIGDSTDLVLKFHRVVRKYLSKADQKLKAKLKEEVRSIIAESNPTRPAPEAGEGELVQHLPKEPSTPGYRSKNIRTLLTEGFSPQDLRIFCYDDPDFRPVHDQWPENADKTQMIQQLIEHAERKELFGPLLTWAKKKNPAKYEQHQPYVDVTTSGKYGSL